MSKKICVYTCITGDYDDLHEVEIIEKPVEEKPVEEKPKEPEPQVTIIQNDLLAEREKQMAALLQSIPAVLEKKEEEEHENEKETFNDLFSEERK